MLKYKSYIYLLLLILWLPICIKNKLRKDLGSRLTNHRFRSEDSETLKDDLCKLLPNNISKENILTVLGAANIYEILKI